MKLTPIETDLDIFDILSEAADDAFLKNPSDEVVGPEDELEEDDIEYQESEEVEEDSDNAPEININIDNIDNSADEEESNTVTENDFSDLAEELENLTDVTTENNELLESIDDTLESQFEADEKQRRKDAIVTESSSPFTALLESGDFERDSESSSGGLLGGLGDLLGFGRNKRDRGGNRDNPDRPRPTTKLGKTKEFARRHGAKGLGGLMTMVLGGFALDSVMDKFGAGSLKDAVDGSIGSGTDVMTAANSMKHLPVYDEDSLTTGTNENLYTTVEKSETSNSEEETNRVEKVIPERDLNLNKENKTEVNKPNPVEFSILSEPVSNPEDSSIIENALLAAGVGVLGVESAKAFIPNRTPVLAPTVPVSEAVRVAQGTADVAGRGTSILSKATTGIGNTLKSIPKLPLIGNLIGAAMVGSDIVDQRSQEYENEDDKNRDTAKLAGSFAGNTAASMAGATLGTMVFPGIGTAIGGALGYYLGDISGLGDKAGEIASSVYDVANATLTTMGNSFDSVTSFFTAEEENNTELTEIQAKTMDELKDDLKDDSSLFGANSWISNLFGGGAAPINVAPNQVMSSEVFNPLSVGARSSSSNYSVTTDNDIVIPAPETVHRTEPVTAKDISSIVTNNNSVTNAEKPKATMTVKQTAALNTDRPESNSYSAQRPSLNSVPVYIENGTLSLIHMGYA